MFYRLCSLLLLALLIAPAHAQIITDPARAAAARDTLLHQAEQLRLRAEQTSPFFITNAQHRGRRRVVVQGIVRINSASSSPAGVRQSQWAADNTSWRHVTRYRRNGRVQERFRITANKKNILKETRLNGNVLWVSIPASYATVMGIPIRHRGVYLRTGYVLLDKEMYALPNQMQ